VPADFAYSGEYIFYGDRVEWIFVSYLPDTNVTLTLIAPPLWREMAALRIALESQPNAEAWLRLGDIYTQLAEAGATDYDAQAEAAYFAARELDLARQEAQALHDLTSDEGARTFIVEADAMLAKEWLERNAPYQAYEHLSHAWELATETEQEALAPLRTSILTQLLHTTLKEEGLAAMMAQAEDLHATDLLAPLTDVPRPWFEHRAVQVTTSTNGRTITLTFYNVQDETAARAALDQVCGEMNRVVSLDTYVRCAVPLPNAEVVITFDGTSPALWQERATTLLPTIPDNATFDLLRSVLQTSTLDWYVHQGWRERRVRYVEDIHLLTPQASTLAEHIRTQAETASSPLLRDTLSSIADAWDNIASYDSVRYEIFFPHNGRTLTRAWTRPPPPSSGAGLFRSALACGGNDPTCQKDAGGMYASPARRTDPLDGNLPAWPSTWGLCSNGFPNATTATSCWHAGKAMGVGVFCFRHTWTLCTPLVQPPNAPCVAKAIACLGRVWPT